MSQGLIERDLGQERGGEKAAWRLYTGAQQGDDCPAYVSGCRSKNKTRASGELPRSSPPRLARHAAPAGRQPPAAPPAAALPPPAAPAPPPGTGSAAAAMPLHPQSVSLPHQCCLLPQRCWLRHLPAAPRARLPRCCHPGPAAPRCRRRRQTCLQAWRCRCRQTQRPSRPAARSRSRPWRSGAPPAPAGGAPRGASPHCPLPPTPVRRWSVGVGAVYWTAATAAAARRLQAGRHTGFRRYCLRHGVNNWQPQSKSLM